MNALKACSWNFLVLKVNAPTLNSRHFGSKSGKGNFDQRLLLKHGMVPEYSQSVAIFRSADIAFSEVYTTIGELRIQFR